jgi:hypothetical protein
MTFVFWRHFFSRMNFSHAMPTAEPSIRRARHRHRVVQARDPVEMPGIYDCSRPNRKPSTFKRLFLVTTEDTGDTDRGPRLQGDGSISLAAGAIRATVASWLTMSHPHDHCPAVAFSLRVLGVPYGVVRLSHPLAVRLANYLAAFISLLCACMAFGGCEPPMTARVATPEEIRTFFENKKMKVLTFLGYSGAEYENKAMMLEQAARILNQFDPRTTIVNIGGHRRRHRFSLRGSETEGVPDFRHRVDSGERKQRRPIALR